jgi:hypothetical protein
MDDLIFRKICAPPATLDGYVAVAKSVANNGTLLFLFVEADAKEAVTERYAQGFGTFPRPRMNSMARFLLVYRDRTDWNVIDLPELNVTFPLVDMFPDGSILIVGPRSAWRKENDYDLNGVIFDPRTKQLSRVLLGDGINSAFVDKLGRIWVSYSDEGIFGNFGWGGPGPTPVGAAGLVCFSRAGDKIWEFPDDSIADCYALNVFGSEAAVCTYTDFPIWRISDSFGLKHWKSELGGCRTFAISDNSILAVGQYDDPPSIAHLGRLGQQEPTKSGSVKTSAVQLLLPDGSALSDGRLIGRGSYLYYFDEAGVYRADIDVL